LGRRAPFAQERQTWSRPSRSFGPGGSAERPESGITKPRVHRSRSISMPGARIVSPNLRGPIMLNRIESPCPGSSRSLDPPETLQGARSSSGPYRVFTIRASGRAALPATLVSSVDTHELYPSCGPDLGPEGMASDRWPPPIRSRHGRPGRWARRLSRGEVPEADDQRSSAARALRSRLLPTP
jgi:hypothetical protein